MAKIFGAQSQRFDGIVQAIGQSQCACWKVISPDSDILRAIKQASPNTPTIVRIYTGAPTVDDVNQHPNAEQYGVDYATKVYAQVKDPAHMDFLESENEPNDHYDNLTEFIKRQSAFLVGFSRRARELGFKPLGPNFSTGYPECYIKGTNYELWPNAWQGLADGLRALRDAKGALALHEYDAPDLFRLWSDTAQRGYLVGRHKAVYASLPADLQALPLYITEFGIDFLVSNIAGGFWHGRDENTAPEWMVAQMREAWRRVYSTTPQLKGICCFLWGTTDAQFAEYDIVRSEPSVQVFRTFFAEDLPPGVAPSFAFASYPLPSYYPITQGFGENPATYLPFGFPGHEGIDLGCPNNIPVLAVADGKVSVVDSNGNYGKHVALNHAEDYQTTYAHLAHIDVATGQSVKAGQALGASDSTGNVTGPHLHLTLKRLNHDFTDAHGTIWPQHVFDPTAFLLAVTPSHGGPVSTVQEKINAAWNSTGVAFNPATAFLQKARSLNLGRAIANEYSYTASDGHIMAGQGFEKAFLECVKGDFAPEHIHAFDWLTGAPYVPVVQTPVPTGNVPTGFAVPADLIAIGASATEGTPVPGQPFYRLSGASFRSGVSAFCKVSVIGKNGVPAISVQVVNLFPDNNGEILITDGSGVVTFNYGASSAFTPPAPGPFTVFIASGAVKSDGPPKRVSFASKLSDTIVSLGDPNGTHTECYVQFVQQ
jgi:murein DD-endopeptidase MepM/ murein hydrolase activator NlpD